MRSIATLKISPPMVQLISALHHTSGTTEVDSESGDRIEFAPADMSRCRWGRLERVEIRPALSHRVHVPFGGDPEDNFWVMPVTTPTFKLSLRGEAGDPLVFTAADIDYFDTFTIVLAEGPPAAVLVEFEGKIDAFPAFEAYAKLDRTTKTLFREAPPEGNTVVDLLGGVNRRVAGRVAFP